MALDTHKKHKHHEEETEEQRGDFEALIKSATEHPVAYLLAGALIVACILAGVLFRASNEAKERRLATEYAGALEAEDDAERIEKLEPVADAGGDIGARALYQIAETAYREGDFEKAGAAFERVRAEFPDSPFVADAVEGSGFVAEAHDDLESAVAKYREILTNWPDTFTARRQHLNIGRVSEKLGQTEDAVQAYRDQLAAFPESHVAADAQKALARLNAAHPELFAAAAEEETEPAVDAADTAGAVEPADDSGGMAMPTPQLTIPTEAPSQKADAPEAEAEPAAAE